MCPLPFIEFGQQLPFLFGVWGIHVGVPDVEPFSVALLKQLSGTVRADAKCLKFLPEGGVGEEVVGDFGERLEFRVGVRRLRRRGRQCGRVPESGKYWRSGGGCGGL